MEEEEENEKIENMIKRVEANDPTLVKIALVNAFNIQSNIIRLSTAIAKNTVVKKFVLRESDIDDTIVSYIADALKENKSIVTLCLDYNEITCDGAKLIANMLRVNTTLSKLYLGWNTIGNEGLKSISDVLRINTTLSALYLHNNFIESESIRSFADALCQDNATLVCFDLFCSVYNCNIQSDDWTYLYYRLLTGNISLTRIDAGFPNVSYITDRNTTAYKLIQTIALLLIAHRNRLREWSRLHLLPKEIVTMIAQRVWRTRGDVAWLHSLPPRYRPYVIPNTQQNAKKIKL